MKTYLTSNKLLTCNGPSLHTDQLTRCGSFRRIQPQESDPPLHAAVPADDVVRPVRPNQRLENHTQDRCQFTACTTVFWLHTELRKNPVENRKQQLLRKKTGWLCCSEEPWQTRSHLFHISVHLILIRLRRSFNYSYTVYFHTSSRGRSYSTSDPFLFDTWAHKVLNWNSLFQCHFTPWVVWNGAPF